VVIHHGFIRALGTGFLTRWWKDMGDELGHGVPADSLN